MSGGTWKYTILILIVFGLPWLISKGMDRACENSPLLIVIAIQGAIGGGMIVWYLMEPNISHNYDSKKSKK